MMKWSEEIVIVIPAYNEASIIDSVIRDAQKITGQVIVVDDNSKDGTARIARAAGAEVYQHIVNLGLGGALATGFSAALNKRVQIIVTMDADGQHKAEDIPNLIKPIIKEQADVVIGSRLIGKGLTGMPASRRLANFLANLITFLLCGVRTTDSQSGLRAFSRSALQKIEIKSQRMEVASEFFKEIKNKHLRLAEVPIQSIYTEYSLSKGQSFSTGIKTLFRLILDKFV